MVPPTRAIERNTGQLSISALPTNPIAQALCKTRIHALLVFTLTSQGKISSALIDRLPKGRKPVDFNQQRWKLGRNRIEMALDLSDSYRLHGMPRDVFEPLLGPPDGSRDVHGAAWELRINCPTGLLNHDILVYWPTESYPQHLYGGNTEAIGRWVYVHS